MLLHPVYSTQLFLLLQPTCICVIDMVPVELLTGSSGSRSSSSSSCLLGSGWFLMRQALQEQTHMQMKTAATQYA